MAVVALQEERTHVEAKQAELSQARNEYDALQRSIALLKEACDAWQRREYVAMQRSEKRKRNLTRMKRPGGVSGKQDARAYSNASMRSSLRS